MVSYRSRILDDLLAKKLRSIGAVLIEGPRACGKRTTARRAAKSGLLLPREDAAMLLDVDPALLLSGEAPRLIDEWQSLPALWDEIRFEVDRRSAFGQFILTGSAVPADRASIQHTGTGRFARLTLRPMSLFEAGKSSGAVSLQKLFEGGMPPYAPNPLTLPNMAALLCRGGWPESMTLTDDEALACVRDYVNGIVENDLSRLDSVRLRALLRAYARSVGTQSSAEEIHRNIAANKKTTLSTVSVKGYIEALRDIFVVEEVPSWSPPLRTRTPVRKADTRCFVDPSLAAAALGIGPDGLIRELKTFGALFKNLCIRDLRVYSDALRADVCHYRDKNQLECDAVIQRRDGTCGLVDIELGGSDNIEHGAKMLKALAAKIDTSRMPTPAFLMVMTGAGGFAHRRKDGVCVVPAGTLRP